LSFAAPAFGAEFLQRHAAFGFQTDVDDDGVVQHGGDGAAHDSAFHQVAASKARFQH
jgi:hypothetical protein